MYHTHLPKWFVGRAGIYEFELAGVLFGALCAIEIEHGAPLLVFCDNKGALGTVVRAASKTTLGRAVCSVIWGAAAAAGSSIWIEYVMSALNLSDPPSRKCTLLKDRATRLEYPDLGVPKPFLFPMQSETTLFAAQKCFAVAERGFSKGRPCDACALPKNFDPTK